MKDMTFKGQNITAQFKLYLEKPLHVQPWLKVGT